MLPGATSSSSSSPADQGRCVLVLGFEEMQRGLSEPFPDMLSPVARQFAHMAGVEERSAEGKMAVGPGLKGQNKFTVDTCKLFALVGHERSYSRKLL